MKNYHIAFMLLILITLSNCSKAKNEMIFINNLKNDISELYDIKRIDIKLLNQDDIKISIIDSRLNNYSVEEKQKIAKQIGELVSEGMPQIKTGEILFTDKSNYLIVKTSKSESFNLF